MHRLFKVSGTPSDPVWYFWVAIFTYKILHKFRYNLPNTNSKKGVENNQSRTSVGSFSAPRLQISTLRACKLFSKGRVNSFYLFEKISTTKTAAEEQRKRHEEQAVKWMNAEEVKTSAEEQRKESSP
jgi:hypothetical protein